MSEEPSAVPLTAPREEPKPLVDTPEALASMLTALAAGYGPVAVDAERAGGYRYSQRAYLVQMRREGAGTWLIDPIALPDLAELSTRLGSTEWILHAAGQDLPSLLEVGLIPNRLFDTELAGRLLGMERVGLSAMVENLLGFSLAKDHSAADWSSRPLPSEWLNYAALDVELLVELRQLLGDMLSDAGRLEWAQQEFDYVRTLGPPAPRTEPWRRMKGLRTRSRRGLAIAREVWTARDQMARERDVTPSRLLHDTAISAMTEHPPSDYEGIKALPRARSQSSALARTWLAAIDRARALPESDLPTLRVPSEGPPNPRNWARVNPLAAARLEATRGLLTDRAEEIGLPRENLLPPRALRAIVWELSPPDASAPDPATVSAALQAHAVRAWQQQLTRDLLVSGLQAQLPASESDHDPEPALNYP